MSEQYSILYLDDEEDNLTSFKAVFRRNFKIYTAQDASEALDLLSLNTIDLVISDQRMPGITGVEFLQKVHQSHPHIIRMILTGYSDMQAIIDAINKGKIYHYITKPWKFESLKVILDNAFETYTLRQKNALLEEEKKLLLIKTLQQDDAVRTALSQKPDKPALSVQLSEYSGIIDWHRPGKSHKVYNKVFKDVPIHTGVW